ncbi:hypothetical protein [Rhodanobacter lindaniclasticus]
MTLQDTPAAPPVPDACYSRRRSTPSCRATPDAMEEAMAIRRLVLLFDGTWNSPNRTPTWSACAG